MNSVLTGHDTKDFYRRTLLSPAVVLDLTMINLCRTGLSGLVIAGIMSLVSAAASAADTLRLATTTSTTNSGLLDHLLPELTKATNITLEIQSVGSGQALRMGRMGQVDLVWVNAPASETEFVMTGHGLKRIPIMRNKFVIVGPKNDPAGLSAAKSIGDAMERIARGSTRFVSRADDSGTHKRELTLWQTLDQIPYGAWYYEAGLGMQSVLDLASDLQAYTLTDTGTWLHLRSTLNLKATYQSSEPPLQNPYSVIAVNPAKHAAGAIRTELANRFIDWLTSDAGQSLIADFRVDDTLLFSPMSNRGED